MTARCQTCGLRPRAFVGVRICFECWPGGAATPPPCLRCGSTSNYWSAGLCEACHHLGPRSASNCVDCLAWGVHGRNAHICRTCDSWRRVYRDRVEECRGCGRMLSVGPEGCCRLCHAQSRSLIDNATGDGLQLFFAGMLRPPGGVRRSTPVRHAVVVRPIRPVAHRQLVLLEVPIDMEAGLRLGFPPPPDPELAAALRAIVWDYAARHGWSLAVKERVWRGARIMLGIQHTPGAPIRASDIALLGPVRLSVTGVTAVLRAAGMLDDDSVPAVVRWFPVFVAELPEPMRAELAVWFDVWRNGSRVAPRSRPRDDRTVSSQLRFAMPALRVWAQRYQSLREVAREDVHAVLPAAGSERVMMLQGLRSIFRVLKAKRLVFLNPTTHLSVPKRRRAAPPAVDLAALRAVLEGDDRAAAALAALLAFHGIRLYQLCHARLTDVRDGRFYVGEQVILLAPTVRERLDAYLTERTSRWPRTANPHLFINYKSAHTTAAVTPWWIRRRLGMSGQLIRMDRILDEAHATRGDVRQLCDLFGLTPTTAGQYAAMVLGPDDAPERVRAPGAVRSL